jgi:hypothetical protein
MKINWVAIIINMACHVCNVVDVFTLSGKGVIVVTDGTLDILDKLHCTVKIGDPVEIRIASEVVVRSTISGIAMLGGLPAHTPHAFDFMVPSEISKDDIPIGSEVWIDLFPDPITPT